jgi:hypothetical protein
MMLFPAGLELKPSLPWLSVITRARVFLFPSLDSFITGVVLAHSE